MAAGRQRAHANGWVATVLLYKDGAVEGYLWDEHRQPLGMRRTGIDLDETQRELDVMAEGHGHTCSQACGAWTNTA